MATELYFTGTPRPTCVSLLNTPGPTPGPRQPSGFPFCPGAPSSQASNNPLSLIPFTPPFSRSFQRAFK